MTNLVLVDTNIILDTIHNDARFGESSWKMMAYLAQDYQLAINPIIYGELAVDYDETEKLNHDLALFEKIPLPFEAAFIASKAFQEYRSRGGAKTSTLPDFLIGAHASYLNIPLVTRDKKRYQTYFPEVKIISN